MLWCERVPPIVGCLRAGPQLAQGTLLHARSRRGAVSGAPGARAGASGSTRSLVEPRSVEDVTLAYCLKLRISRVYTVSTHRKVEDP